MCCPDSILGLKCSLLQLLGVLATDRFQLSPSPEASLAEERHLGHGHMLYSSSLHLMTGPILEYKVLPPCAKMGPIWKAILALTFLQDCLRLVALHLYSFIHLTQFCFPHLSHVLSPRALFNKCPVCTSQSLFPRELYLWYLVMEGGWEKSRTVMRKRMLSISFSFKTSYSGRDCSSFH